MVMLIDAQAGPPLLLAHTMYCVRVKLTVGEPVIDPLLKLSPVGNAGSMAHDCGIPLVLVDQIASQTMFCSPRMKV